MLHCQALKEQVKKVVDTIHDIGTCRRYAALARTWTSGASLPCLCHSSSQLHSTTPITSTTLTTLTTHANPHQTTSAICGSARRSYCGGSEAKSMEIPQTCRYSKTSKRGSKKLSTKAIVPSFKTLKDMLNIRHHGKRKDKWAYPGHKESRSIVMMHGRALNWCSDLGCGKEHQVNDCEREKKKALQNALQASERSLRRSSFPTILRNLLLPSSS